MHKQQQWQMMVVTAMAGLALLVAGCGAEPSTSAAGPSGTPSESSPAAAPAAASLGVEQLPAPAAAELSELHGHVEAGRFWIRLHPASAEYGGHRSLEVLYPPPHVDDTAGAILNDCPRVLVDAQLRVLAWREPGQSFAQAIYQAGEDPAKGFPGYSVVREVEQVTPDVTFAIEEQRVVSGAIGWDRRLALPMLALNWRAGSSGAMPVVDLWGEHPTAELAWLDTTVQLPDGRAGTIEADADGRLARVLVDGVAVLTVDGWLAAPAL